MKRPGNLEALRRELSRMTRLDVEEHERWIEGVRTTHPHEIELLERADPGREFACVMYACVFRSHPGTDSGGTWAPIPE